MTERITVKVNTEVHRKLIKKQHRIFLKTGKKVSLNDIIDKGVKLWTNGVVTVLELGKSKKFKTINLVKQKPFVVHAERWFDWNER